MVELDRNVESGNAWVFGVAFLFVLGIISVLIIPVLDDYVAPALIAASSLTGAELTLYENQVSFVMFAVKTTPFILGLVVVIYLLLSVVRREKDEQIIV